MLYLVRHGRTQFNAQGRLQGRLDIPLDDVGVRQAEAIAERVGALSGDTDGVSRVVASPLGRAQQTANAFGLEVATDDRWIEMDYGIYEGSPLEDLPAEVWQRWYDDPDFAPEGAESFAHLTARVHAALDQIADEARSSNVVVVTHSTPVKAAVAWCLGAGHHASFRSTIGHGALTTFGFGRFGPRLVCFNEQPVIDQV